MDNLMQALRGYSTWGGDNVPMPATQRAKLRSKRFTMPDLWPPHDRRLRSRGARLAARSVRDTAIPPVHPAAGGRGVRERASLHVYRSGLSCVDCRG